MWWWGRSDEKQNNWFGRRNWNRLQDMVRDRKAQLTGCSSKRYWTPLKNRACDADSHIICAVSPFFHIRALMHILCADRLIITQTFSSAWFCLYLVAEWIQSVRFIVVRGMPHSDGWNNQNFWVFLYEHFFCFVRNKLQLVFVVRCRKQTDLRLISKLSQQRLLFLHLKLSPLWMHRT